MQFHTISELITKVKVGILHELVWEFPNTTKAQDLLTDRILISNVLRSLEHANRLYLGVS